jgi:hypothetical protein
VRQRALLAFSVPLAAAGCLAGHAAGYALVGMSRQDMAAHGYLGYAPHLLGASVVVLAIALVLRVGGRLQGRPAAWPFALLPPLAFACQELLERIAAGLPAHAALEPAVYVGLAAQLPVAVLAFLAARALLRVADTAAGALARRSSLPLRAAPLLVPGAAAAPASRPFAFARPGRAPPRS